MGGFCWQQACCHLLMHRDGGGSCGAGVTKLQDANDAGTKLSTDCTLILTEGDSAKALVIDGLSVAGRDAFGVFPLRCCTTLTPSASLLA